MGKDMRLILKGQVRGGKNNMGVTRSGIHYPKPSFVLWRNQTVAQILVQKPPGFKPIDNADWVWTFSYTPEDNRRRDMPATLDAVFHCLEKTNIVTDDRWIQDAHFKQYPASKENAGLIIDLEDKAPGCKACVNWGVGRYKEICNFCDGNGKQYQAQVQHETPKGA